MVVIRKSFSQRTQLGTNTGDSPTKEAEFYVDVKKQNKQKNVFLATWKSW